MLSNTDLTKSSFIATSTYFTTKLFIYMYMDMKSTNIRTYSLETALLPTTQGCIKSKSSLPVITGLIKLQVH